MLSEEERRARRRDQMRRWRAANPDRARQLTRESARRARAANPERARERDRQWRSANLETARKRVRERHRRYRALDAERTRELFRQWYASNLEKAQEQGRIKNHVRRARIRGAIDPCQPVTVAIKDRRFLLYGNVCCFCGAGGKLTLEHVVALNRGGLHVPSNLAPSCVRCNCSKRDSPVETWYPRQPFFNPECWEFLQAHTGNRWSVAEQLTLFSLL